MARFLLFVILACCTGLWATVVPDTVMVSAPGLQNKNPVGVWWPAAKAKSRVVVWFHGGMTSGNCQKGLVAGEGFSKLFPDVVVVSASACRENHWASENMMAAVDAALDSVAARRKSPVEEVSLVGVSDGSLGVIVYSMNGRRRVKDRLLVSTFGKLLGDAPLVAASPKMRSGRWRFLQGGKDRLFPSHEALPWIQDFCRNVGADCDVRYDPEGEHDWSYWEKNALRWIKDAIFMKTP